MCKLLEKDKATALAKATENAAAELAAAKAEWESEMNATMAQKLEQAEVAKRNAVRDVEEDAEVCSFGDDKKMSFFLCNVLVK